jgi:nicotinamide-nucleotide amidase
MHIRMIAVGDELLDGRVADTNSARVAQRLRPWGLTLHHTQAVPDDLSAILDALAAPTPPPAGGLIILSGGLGVTADDLTRQALSRFLDLPLVEDADAITAITERLTRRDRALSADLRGHALLPQGATPLANPAGLAIGFCVAYPGHPRTQILTFPGVPDELEAMLDAHLPAILQAAAAGSPDSSDGPDSSHRARWEQRRFGFVGATERDLEQLLPPLPEGVRVSINVKSGVVEVSLSAQSSPARALLSAAESTLRASLAAPYLITTGGDLPHHAVARLLLARQQTLATAESCTGGLLAHSLTDIPGISSCFIEGFVTYANQAKVARLGVRPETLASFGAVSRHTVEEMALGAKRAAQTDWAIATSGIAGPGGAVPGKPTGLVHTAIAGPDGLLIHRPLFLPGRARALVKQVTAHTIFSFLLCAMEGRPLPPLAPLPAEIFLD